MAENIYHWQPQTSILQSMWFGWKLLHSKNAQLQLALLSTTTVWNIIHQSKKYSLEKTLMLGKIEGRRRRERQRMGWLDGITESMDMSLSKLRDWWWTGKSGMLQSMGLQSVGHDWTELRAKNKIPESKGINITFQFEKGLTFWL